MYKIKIFFFYFILLSTCYVGKAQCSYTGTPLTQVGSTYTFCIDNGSTYTTATVNSGQYIMVNVIKGFTYTFSVGNVFTSTENLTILDASTNGNVSPATFASGASGATISNWVASLSGQIKVLLSRASCANSNVTGGTITLTLNATGNTQDSQTAYGTDQWVAHVYNWTGGAPPGGTSPSTPSTTTSPFTNANYVGYYTVGTESISETFGGDYNCFPVYSNGVVRTNMYTEQFAVRYRMRSTKIGCYSLSTTGDDGVRVYVDGVKVYDEWKEQSPTSYSNILLYLNGNSEIIFDYYENGGQNVNSFSLTPFNAASNTIAQNAVTVCSGVSAGLLDGSSYTYTGGATNPTISFQWQSSTDNITFTNIAGGTTEDYTPPTQTTTTTNLVRYYRRIVTAAAATASGCSYTSNVTTVTTSPGVPSTPGSISGTAAQCPSITSQVYNVSAVTNTTSYNWTVPTGWAITSGAGTTSITVTTGAGGQNGSISVAAVNGCGSSTARTLAVTVNSNNTVSAASSSPTLCINSALTAVTHTTTGATSIGTATGLPTGVSSSWASNTITISGTPTASGTFNYSIPLTGGCGTVNATGTIVVNPNLPASVSIASSATTICVGTSVTFTATPTNGGTTPTYQWKVNGTNVSGQTSSTFTSTTLSNNDAVTVVMISNATPCLTGSPVTSNSITETVIPASAVGTASSSQTICSGTQPASITLSSNTGTIQWQSSTDNITFTTIVGATSSTLLGSTIGILNSTTYYRAVITNGVCSSINSNIVTVNVSNYPGNFGNALNLDGTNDYVVTPNIASSMPTNDVTVELWFKANAAGVIIDELGQSVLNGNWHDSQIEILSTGEVKVRVWSLNSISLGIVAFGSWNHAVVRYNSTTSTLDGLLNGIASTTTTIGTRLKSTGSGFDYHYAFGGTDTTNMGSGAYFNGTIDEVRIWNTARSNAQIQATINTELLGNEAGLVAYYNFNQGIVNGTNTGLTTLYDKSSNSYNATLNNFALTGTASNYVGGNTFSIASITGTTSACIGTTTQLRDATYGGVWSSSNLTIATVNSATGLVTAVSSGSATITYALTSNAGCSSSVNTSFTVTANNTAGVASSFPTLCVNTTLIAITHTTTGATGIGTATGLPAGVTATWASNTITISGTPTASGTFNYSIPLTGGCGTVNAIGTITVTTANTAGTASSTPTLCIATALTSITHTTTGATGIGTATGLPAGVTAAWSSNTITISGTPTASGTFNYSIPLTGGCGTVNATGTISVSNYPGNFGNALNFDGSNDSVATPITMSASYTKEAWIYLPTIDANPHNIISAAGSSAGSYLFIWNSGKLTAGQNTTTFIDVQDTATLNTNTWYHVAVTYDAPTTTMKLYKNGVLVATNNSVAAVASNFTTALGSYAGGAFFQGNIDDVRVWNSARSISQIQASMNTELLGNETGLLAYYNFNQGIANGTNTGVTTLYDKSTNSNNGTLTNFALAGTTSNYVGGNSFSIAPITGTVTICSSGITSQLSDATYGGVWSSSNTSVATVNSTTGLVTSVGAGSTTITYALTSNAGCLSSVNTSFIVTANNTAATASSTPTLCINTAITPNITITTTGATGIGTATGLPAGVTVAWASNTITISGTPTASGTFNYTIPLTGGCGTVNATGTITVTAANTAGIASSTPTLCINTALTAITQVTTGATGIGTATGLPAGVTAAWASNVITISGTPTASGTFNYSIPLTGGCSIVNATGTITVTAANTAGTASSTPTLCINTALTPITRTTTGATGIGTATGLPAGVTAAWASNVITISGTPTASGTFNYSIPLTGGCSSVNATGTITVTPANTAGTASSTPTLCINTALTPITRTTTGATGIGTATGLPAGVTAAWASNVITISGTPTASGTFNYSIPLTGGCSSVNATGTITVTPANTAGTASSTPTLCINTALTPITRTTTGATGIGSATGLPTGVTAAWASNVITISGTPTASGTFNYSIPLTGGCSSVNATGTITVTPANTAGTASSTPTLCINTALTPITRTTTGATGIGTATGLPAGVTTAWASNVITISGTPTASGTFNYSIPLTGGCSSVNATGTITVTPANTAGTASSTPTLCINTVLTPITRTTTGATGIVTATGLPAGITAAWASNVITISGTPTASGTFNYSIPLTGGCSSVNATGTITVNPNITVSAASGSPTLCINTALTAFTHTTSGATGIGSATGLPAGVTAAWASNTLTISGTPTNSGTFNYSIPVTGGCATVNATGSISVRPAFTSGAISSTGEIICPNGTPTLGINSVVAASGGDGVITYKWQANGVDIPGSNSNTFDPPAGLTVTTTYTRFAKDATCNSTFTISSGSWVVSVSNTNTWTGAVSTSWTATANWSCGYVPTSTTAVVIGSGSFYPVLVSDVSIYSLTLNSGTTLKINSTYDLTVTDVIVNNGTLTFENNSNLVQVNNVSNTGSGSTIIKRNSSALKRLDYTLWSSPVTGQGLYAFSPFTLPNRFYVYNTATNLYTTSVGFNLTGLQYPSPLVSPNGVNGTDSNTIQFVKGKSYLIRVPWDHPTAATVWEGKFTGIPNNGNATFAMTTGYNAVGNPYPSRINVHNFIDGNANISGPLYFWRKTNTTALSTSYATLTKTAYVANGAAGGDTGTSFFNAGDEANWTINIGQGFIVNASSNANLTFSNSMRRSSNANQFFKTTESVNSANSGLYWLNFNIDAGVYSQMALGYSSEGTLAEDRGIDGKNINQEFYLTSLIGTDEYAIQGRPEFDSSDVVPLSYKIATAGNYTISIDHTTGLFNGGSQPIYLKDNLTTTIHDLNTGAFSFTTAAGTFTNRFEIVYALPLGIEKPIFTANNVVIYNQNNEFVVTTGSVIMSSVKIFDIRGRLLEEKNDINASQTTIGSGLANEVLLVQITSEDGEMVTKKVIR